MVSENFTELMRLIMGPCLGRIGVVNQLLDHLDVMAENEKKIVHLYSILPQDEQCMARKAVQVVCDVMNPPPPNPLEGIEQPKPVAESIKITVNNVHRNEQVNIVALSKGSQTILCINLNKFSHREYYAMWPAVGDTIQFELSEEGETFQMQIRSEFRGKNHPTRLDGFPITFAAKVYAYSKLPQNTIEFWEEMRNEGLFKYWNPEKGPYTFLKKAKKPEVAMLRVYKVDCDLKPHILPNAGYRNEPKWKGGVMGCQGRPVLTDLQMEAQLNKFNEILIKHGNPPARLCL